MRPRFQASDRRHQAHVIHAVILDIGGVVASYVPGVDVDGAWERRLGLAAGDMQRLVWSSPSAARAQIGELAVQDFWSEIGAMLELDDREARELYEDCWSLTRLDDAVAAWLDGLRPRYKVASLSNGWSEDRQECEERMGLSRFFDTMVFSAEEGIAKPTAEIYLRTLQRLGVEAHEAVFFDDRLENVAAAQALGITSVRVTAPADLVREGSALLPID